MGFGNDLKSFMERMGTPLAKAVHPDDFAGILNETDPKGADVVDHLADLEAHPSRHKGQVEHYRKTIAGEAPIIRTTPEKLRGVSAKSVYSLPKAGSLTNPDKVLVKPYHEKLNPRAEYWQKHPIQGWAEMTNQALWHAADVGHLHQKVHVSEHDMGPGFAKHPAVVIHMDPRAKPVAYLPGDPNAYDDSMYGDAFKIGVMDFLTNNMDRHRENLLYFPEGTKDENGVPLRSRLLAIDHGRNFQYHASHKGAPKFEHDPLIGTFPIPEEDQKQINLEGKTVDSPLFYLDSDALRHVSGMSAYGGSPPLTAPRVFVKNIVSWWPQVREQVVRTMALRLRNLREPRMRDHVWNNFIERVKKLDDIAARPDFYLKEARGQDLDVPLHVWNRD